MPQPDSILPPNVCDRIHELAQGNPGRLNTIARGTLQHALALPASVADVGRYERYTAETRARPDLIVSLDGQVLETVRLEGHKVTIGLSSLADIVIHNDKASHFHALLLSYPDALVLVDLNSAQGTFVNAARVSSTILKSDDIISLASHRIKVLNAPAPGVDRIDEERATECSKFKTLDAARAQRRAPLTSSIPAK